MRRTALLLAVSILLAACGDEEATEPAATTPATPTAAATPPAAQSPAATATTAPQVGGQIAVWPHPDAPGDDPVAVARSLVIDYIGLEQAPLSDFREGEPGAGEIDVFRMDESGGASADVVATISLRQIENRWSVTSVQSPEVDIDVPEPLAKIASPVTISGRGRGFEGNIVLEVRAGGDTNPLAQEPVIAGSAAELEPFSAELTFEGAGTDDGAIVAYTGSGIDKALGFAIVPVRF